MPELKAKEPRATRRSSEVSRRSLRAAAFAAMHSDARACVCAQEMELVHAEREAKRAAKRAKLEAKRAAANIFNSPPAVEPMTARDANVLPVAVAVPMPTPVGMPNLA
eukprot:7386805-Prymnesium_polylepis.1